jgi:hypothetical protein
MENASSLIALQFSVGCKSKFMHLVSHGSIRIRQGVFRLATTDRGELELTATTNWSCPLAVGCARVEDAGQDRPRRVVGMRVCVHPLEPAPGGSALNNVLVHALSEIHRARAQYVVDRVQSTGLVSYEMCVRLAEAG